LRAPAAIAYTLEPHPPSGNAEAVTRVGMTVTGHGGRAFTVEMPAWSPGDYWIQNHGRYVRSLQAAGGAVQAAGEDVIGAWRIEPQSEEPVVIRYELPDTPPGHFSENVDVRSRHAFYNGPATFAYVAGRKAEPVSLKVTVPEGWDGPLTPMEQTRDGGFRAPDYDTLADSPILVGDRVMRTFSLDARRHDVAFFGTHRGTDYDDYAAQLRRIAEAARAYMGSLPYEHYVLFLDMNGRGGGLEHANSARIALPSGVPAPFAAGFIAHEFFHLWNVKRIRPEVLGPFDYRKPALTRNLWFCEGATEYVAGILTLRAGIRDEEGYFESLGSGIAAWTRSSANRTVTADAASLHIWDEGRSNGYDGVSVYSSGEMIGLCLDLRLLELTDARSGLREVMRDLMERYAPPKPGYGEDGIREAVIRAGGPSIGPFYDRLCRSTAELPIAECLGYAGVRLSRAALRTPVLVADPQATERQRRLRSIWLYGR